MIHYSLAPFRSGFHGSSPCFVPPQNAIGSICLRSLPAHGGSDFAFMALDDSISPLDADDRVYASAPAPVHDLDLAIKPADRQAWADQLGIALAGGVSKLSDLLAATFLAGDPEGQNAVKPLLPAGDQFEIHLGGHSRVWSRALSKGNNIDPFVAKAMAVHGADIKRNPNAILRGKLLTDVLTRHGFPVDRRTAKDVLGIDEEPRARQTTASDDFNRSDANLGGSTASGGGTWTEVVGTEWVGESNQVKLGVIFASKYARLDSDVSSADHIAQITQFTNGSLPGGTYGWGACCRFASGATTCYFFEQVSGGGSKLFKCVAGAETQIGTNGTRTAVQNQVIKIRLSGSSLTGYFDGSSNKTGTDTAITGGTRGGVFGFTNTNALYADDFLVDDEVSASSLRSLLLMGVGT